MRQAISLFSFFCAVFFAIYGSLQAQELTNALEFFPTDLMNPDAEIVDFSSLQAAPEDVPDPAEPEVTELNTIQDFWKLYEVSDSFRRRYSDGTVWQSEEDQLFFFYHLQERITLEDLEKWTFPEQELAVLDPLDSESLNTRRFDAFWITGKLLSFEKTELEKNVAFRYGLSSYFTCRMKLDDGRKVTLFCRQLPRALQKPGALDPPPRVGLPALFLKKGPETENVPAAIPNAEGNLVPLCSLFMLGNRLAWYPDTLLSEAGFDWGLFDDLDREELPDDALRSASSDTRLALRNRECFYQMMNAVFQMSPKKLKKIVADVQENAPDEHFEQIDYAQTQIREDGKKPERYSSVAPIFRQPAKERGNFFFLKGVVRRIDAIRVQDPDINQRFGITHYFEIFLFPDETPQSPVVILVPELPDGIQPGSSLGYYAELKVPAFFFNTWSYENGKNEEGKKIRRFAPLLIGGTPELTVSAVYTPDLFWFYILGGTIFGGLFSLSFILYILSNRENAAFARNRQKMYALPEGTRLENDVETTAEKEREMNFEEWCRKNK
ncbi:MAG: hypothetical protein E7029_04475 [Planctomycetaceae bacterium]|nr:hypothetical protein [Planctomycetaceae bacterium]